MRAIASGLLRSVYAPLLGADPWSLDDLVGGRPVRYYSFARYALLEALRLGGIKAGEEVALPGLICGDLLASVHAIGAVPAFYPVSADLCPDLSSARLSSCRAVVAVNYFGFAEDLEPFRARCRRTGAVLIEDNAHGLFSRDQQGCLLGTRGDFGLFSLRKTLPLPNGAALVVNWAESVGLLGPQSSFDPAGLPPTFRIKQVARWVVPVVGARNLSRLVHMAQALRSRMWREDGLPAQDVSETVLPLPALPTRLLAQPLRVDPARETARRRALYEEVGRLISRTGAETRPVFPLLPSQAVPYGYPFYAKSSAATAISLALGAVGLDCITWPRLPRVLQAGAPDHYRELRLVPFQW